MKEIKAPNSTSPARGDFKVFLAGSIEMGKAIDWQDYVTKKCANYDITFLNPRRDDWDSSWIQERTNHKFHEQVSWELNSMEYADLIVVHFDPNTMSPITLLELGLHAKSKKLIVHCPNGFWRKGNVDIVCDRFHIQQVDSLDNLIQTLIRTYEDGN